MSERAPPKQTNLYVSVFAHAYACFVSDVLFVVGEKLKINVPIEIHFKAEQITTKLLLWGVATSLK